MTLTLSSDFWQTYSESLTFERLDAKNPDQSRTHYTTVGTTDGIVELDERVGYLQSERGLDAQGFVYHVVIETGDVSALLKNKDRITTSDGTHLHIIHIEPVKNSAYTELVCSNVEDPTIQRRRS